MFVGVMPSMSSKERRALIDKLLASRKVIRERFQNDQLQQQDAAAEFEKTYKPLIDPMKETQQAVAASGEETTRVLEALPKNIAARLPKPFSAQKFNQAGLARIQELGAVRAAAELPENWRDLLILPSSLRPADAAKEWTKWIWREATGARQAHGRNWNDFERKVLALRPPPEAEPRRGRGLKVSRSGGCCSGPQTGGSGSIRYFKSSVELMDRLQILAASVQAGNSSLEVKNEAADILKRLHEDSEIDDPTFEGLLRLFI